MKRPLLVKVLTVLDSIVGSAGVAFGAFLLRLSFVRPMDAESAHDLRLASAMFAIPGLIWMGLALLAFRGARWGWGVGVGLNLAVAVVLGMDVIEDWRTSGADDVALAATFVVLTILYLMPSVWRNQRASKVTESITKQAKAAGAA